MAFELSMAQWLGCYKDITRPSRKKRKTRKKE